MIVYVAGIGVLGPGLEDNRQAMEILGGDQEDLRLPVRAPEARGLAPNEARRCPTTARYALDVGQQALRQAGWEADHVATVFSSGSGDLEILDKNCRALAHPLPALSPTLFHNSVHNAAAGYWGIATGSHAATTSLSAYDDSFVAGLLEALLLVAPGNPCLLVAYDIPAPPALATVRHVSAPFAVAFALTADRPPDHAIRLDWRWESQGAGLAPSPLAGDLEALRLSNPAARSLPLLWHMARRISGFVTLPYLNDGRLQVHITCDA